MLGLPEYDYPMPWSIKQEEKLQRMDFPAPLLVKNTFVNFDIGKPASLNEFFEERRTQSCPVSGVSMPPSSADVFYPEASNHVHIETPEMPEAQGIALPMDNFTPVGMLDGNLETPRFLPPPPQRPPAFDTNWSSPVSPAPLHAPVFGIDWQSPAAPAPMHTPYALDINFQCQVPTAQMHAPMFEGSWQSPVPLPQLDATPQPIVLDLVHALPTTLETVQEMQVARPQTFLNEQSRAPGFCLPLNVSTTLRSPLDAGYGSPECPTVGSEGHWAGTCKPCAFFHVRGCSNGSLCVFCHLCDAGEKKRRAKDKRLENSARRQRQ